MRRAYLLCLFTTIWLICTANVNVGINSGTKVNAAKVKTTETTLSIAFSFPNEEIELTSIQVFAPVHKTVEKKVPFIFPVSINQIPPNLYNTKRYSSKVMAVISVISFKLLFPFHHFW
ncbi:MAG: hypothetical protein JWQ09_4313 [Segetibacter sp.]|nr:hypothetical protein [Segetibacter sp.]